MLLALLACCFLRFLPSFSLFCFFHRLPSPKTHTRQEEFRARSACTRVVLRCFLLVATERRMRAGSGDDSDDEDEDDDDDASHDDDGGGGGGSSDGLLRSLVSEGALDPLVAMLASVPAEALRNFCQDMMAVLLREADDDDNGDGDSGGGGGGGGGVGDGAGVPQFSVLFWCVAIFHFSSPVNATVAAAVTVAGGLRGGLR